MSLRTWGFLGSFLALAVAAYFIYPYLNPKEVKKVQQQDKPIANASYNSSLSETGRLKKLKVLNGVIDSLKQQTKLQQQLVDSLNNQLKLTLQNPNAGPAVSSNTSITEISKSLLSLDEDALAPIVDLLEENQLISLYNVGSTRQRKKLLRVLKPEKAAKILKQVM